MRLTVHGRTLLTASGVLALSLLALPSAPHAQAFSHGPLNATIEGGIGNLEGVLVSLRYEYDLFGKLM